LLLDSYGSNKPKLAPTYPSTYKVALAKHMPKENLQRLTALINDRRDELLADWRTQVKRLPGAADLDAPTINDEVPQLLDSLAEDLVRGSEEADAEVKATSAEHGLLRWQAGFDVTEVVAEYNILRICLQELAERNGLMLDGKAARIVNTVFDEAVGRAVKAFETMMTIELRHRHEEHITFVLHDLRTPLEALSLATTLLDRSLESDAKNLPVKSALSVLRRNIDRLNERIRNVLQGTKGLGQTFEPQFTMLNLRKQVEEMIHDLGPIAELSQTKITNEVPADVEVHSETRLLDQVIQNLLSNAVKFTPQGTVIVGARPEQDESVTCWVTDTGKGIAADALDKIFERFETEGSPEQRGIGLGLAIVKEIVELHGGEISVESQIGKGSTFKFRIPGPPAE
jgi:two-component system, OmpR family, phosphate regulon sensor histidine kinase PhoR